MGPSQELSKLVAESVVLIVVPWTEGRIFKPQGCDDTLVSQISAVVGYIEERNARENLTCDGKFLSPGEDVAAFGTRSRIERHVRCFFVFSLCWFLDMILVENGVENKE